MSEVQTASLDFDALLDCEVELLPEFVGFKQMPPGLYTAYATLTPEVSKDAKQFLKLTVTVIESVEAAEGVTPAATNEEFQFQFYTVTEGGIQRIGTAFKPYMLAAGIPSLRELLNQMVGVQVGVKIGTYTSKPKQEGDVAKTYATLDEILPA